VGKTVQMACPPADAAGESVPRTIAELLAAVEVVEETRDEQDTLDIEREAQAIGALAIELRAQLVLADIRDRQGEIAAAARTIHQIYRRALELGDRPLLARAHRLMGRVNYELGDGAAWLEEAVQAVDHLDDDASPFARGQMLIDLANALAVNGEIEAARQRYRAADRVLLAAGRTSQRLTVLNNLAYSEHRAGETQRAWDAAMQLRELAMAQRGSLHPIMAETIARAQIGAGRYAEAEETLTRLTPQFDQADTRPAYLLTLAEVQRHLGRLDEAQANLDEALRACDELDMAQFRLLVLQEQAELLAARGEYQRAYELHKTFHADTEALHRRQRAAQALAQQAMFETREARREARLFREQALRDPLTGLRNRRFVTEMLPAMIDDAARTGRPLSVAMLDLDHFKRVNDTISHDAGDRVLIAVAELLRAAVDRPGESDDGEGGFVARLGGEEFLVVLPDTTAAEAVQHFEALRLAIQGHDWRPIAGDIPLTVSIGTITTKGEQPTHLVLSEADRRLHAAKNGGRDRVVADGHGPAELAPVGGRRRYRDRTPRT